MTGRPRSHSHNYTGLAKRCVILFAVALLILLSSSGLTQNVTNAQGTSKKALFLLPVESYTGIEFSYLQSYLHDKANYDIVVKRDGEVDLETIKHLSDYDVVFINSHGDVANNKFEFATGVTDIVDVNNAQDWKDKLLTHVMFSSGSDWIRKYIPVCRVGVTSSYLAKYNNFHGTLIYAYCCFSQTDGVLARAVMDKGARGVIGFERSAVAMKGDGSGSYWDAREAQKFFDTATDTGVSVDKAYNDVCRDTPGTDPNSHQDTGPPCYGWVLKANRGESFNLGSNGKLPEVPDVSDEEGLLTAALKDWSEVGFEEVRPSKVTAVKIVGEWGRVDITYPGAPDTARYYYRKINGTWTLCMMYDDSPVHLGEWELRMVDKSVDMTQMPSELKEGTGY